jgi:hypothetical protein
MRSTTPGVIGFHAIVPNAPILAGAGFDCSAAAAVPPLTYLTAAALEHVRSTVQSGFVGGNGWQGNVATDLEPLLHDMSMTPENIIGQVLGSFRYENGDIIIYGSKATLHLSYDNSGSITFNDGEILTLQQMPACLRAVALNGALIF